MNELSAGIFSTTTGILVLNLAIFNFYAVDDYDDYTEDVLNGYMDTFLGNNNVLVGIELNEFIIASVVVTHLCFQQLPAAHLCRQQPPVTQHCRRH
ncbi:hypothetical protein BDA99DRAFT_561250 [Phascolomyces articulosus]|uniref:Uncharacterized protein n=1 Tax=Phascolomyces articulosus TaxID=60185 RepID=A0AAD5PCW9_9FUNG|nr:hypothetical protein BDA99DRAFT_561250 [Phascolomyces articulosus]